MQHDLGLISLKKSTLSPVTKLALALPSSALAEKSEIVWEHRSRKLKSRGSLLIWLDEDMCWHSGASGKRGRRPTYSEAAIQFCLTIKGLFDLALPPAIGIAQSLLKLDGLDWQVPDFSTISRR